MHQDVVDIRGYYRTTQGEVARRLLVEAARRHWGEVKGLDVAGLGYAVPVLKAYLDEAGACLALMPAQQGVVHWPPGRPSAVALVEDTALPVPDGAIDRLVLLHALEPAEAIRELMNEVWRVLRPNGEVMAIVANRLGLWARSDETPFGTGRSFTRGQLMRLFDEGGFQVEETSFALCAPPSRSRLVLRSAEFLEGLGRRLWPGLAGAIVLVARKRVYAPRLARRRVRVLQGVGGLLPKPLPQPQPAGRAPLNLPERRPPLPQKHSPTDCSR